MSYTVSTPYKSGTIDSVSNNVITIGTGSDAPAAADISRSDDNPTNQPRILFLVTGSGRGQYRKIIAQTATTYTLDYPFNISAYRGETYSNGDRVTEVNPSNGDKYVLSRTLKEVYDLAPDGDLTWDTDATIDTGNQQVYTMRASTNSSSTQTLTIGDSSTDEICIIYDENVTFKVRMNRFRLYPETSSEIRGGMVLGYTNPGFDTIDHYVSSTQTNITAGQLVQDDDGSLYKALNNVNNVDTSTDFTTSDWTDAFDGSNGFTEYGCTFIDTHNSNSGTNTMGAAFFNGCQIICDPITSNEGPWTIQTNNRTFWRWFGSGSTAWLIRMWETDVVGPIGGRFKGQRSILLDTTFRTGGQPLGSFNPASDGGSTYFGLIKGCTWEGKSQGLYVWFEQGPEVEVESPIFKNITTQVIRLGSGSESSSDYLRLKNFDTDQVVNETAFGDSSVSFINNNKSSGNVASVEVRQDVDVAYTDASLNDITDRTLKLAWTDSQNNDGTAVTSSTSAFATQALLRWDADPIGAGTTNWGDGTDYAPFDFLIVSYEDNNQSFQDGLTGAVDTTRVVTSDSRVTSTRTQAAALTESSSTEDAYDALKVYKYDNPYDGGVTNPMIMSRNTGTNTLEFDDDSIDAINVEFDDDLSGAISYTDSLLTFNLADGGNVPVNIDVGTSNDVNVNDHTIAASITAQNITHSFSTGDTIITTSSTNDNVTISGTITLNDGTYTIDGDGRTLDVSGLTIAAGSGQTDITVKLIDTTGDSPSINSGDESAITLEEEIAFTIDFGDVTPVAANLKYRAAEYDGSSEDTSRITGTTAVVDNTLTVTFEVSAGNTVRMATWYDEYAFGYADSSSTTDIDYTTALTSTQINFGAWNNATDSDHADYDSVLGGYVESTNTNWSWAFASNTLTITAPDTAVSFSSDISKALVYYVLAGEVGEDKSDNSDEEFLYRITTEDLDVDAFEWETVGIKVKSSDITGDPAKHIVQFNHTSSTTDTEWLVQIYNELDANQAGPMSTSTSAERVRFAAAANNFFVGANALSSVKDQLGDELDERYVTGQNMINLGDLAPVDTD